MNPTASMTTSIAGQDAFDALIQQVVAEVNQELDRCLAGADLAQNLREAVRYAALGGGKRLRPVLVALSCEAVGGRRADSLPPACAMELIHCFSLVHDDLPAMDDDALRRGQPTLHVHAGEAMAILAGDVMVSLAFSLLAKCRAAADVRARMVDELAVATTRMINGQVYDTLGGFEPSASLKERLDRIHRNKTGALIGASCRLGGLAGHADPAQLEALGRFGEALGLMFQVVDDLLDVTQSAEHIGKATGKDVAAGKITFPGVVGVPASHAEVRRLRQEALDALRNLDSAADPLRDLCDQMAVRTK